MILTVHWNDLSISCSQALEPSLTHESIAKAIGVSSSDGLIVTHLGERFVSIIGPIFAQRKVNMMQHKNFAPMDVTAHPLKVCMYMYSGT